MSRLILFLALSILLVRCTSDDRASQSEGRPPINLSGLHLNGWCYQPSNRSDGYTEKFDFYEDGHYLYTETSTHKKYKHTSQGEYKISADKIVLRHKDEKGESTGFSLIVNAYVKEQALIAQWSMGLNEGTLLEDKTYVSCEPTLDLTILNSQAWCSTIYDEEQQTQLVLKYVFDKDHRFSGQVFDTNGNLLKTSSVNQYEWISRSDGSSIRLMDNGDYFELKIIDFKNGQMTLQNMQQENDQEDSDQAVFGSCSE